MTETPAYPKWHWKVTAVFAACGTLAGSLMMEIAAEHNPQGVFTDHPGELGIIFVSWFVVVFGFLEGFHQGMRFLDWLCDWLSEPDA